MLETTVDCRKISGSILHDRDEEIEQIGSRVGVFAEVDQDAKNQTLLERFGEEEQTNEGGNAGLVEKLYGFASRSFTGRNDFLLTSAHSTFSWSITRDSYIRLTDKHNASKLIGKRSKKTSGWVGRTLGSDWGLSS